MAIGLLHGGFEHLDQRGRRGHELELDLTPIQGLP
jgi:hypothetical protein